MNTNTDLSDNISESDIINDLIAEKNKLVNEGRYSEAEVINKKIKDLKAKNMNKKEKSLSQTQIKENNNLEEAYNTECQLISNEWDEKINKFIIEGKQMQSDLNASHSQQIENAINDLTKNYPPIKYSKKYLDNKSREICAAKQEKYKLAQYYKNICDKLQKEEDEKYIKERNAKINLKINNLNNKQKTERKILQEKLDFNYQLMNIQKDKDIKQCCMKYKNMQNEMEYFHKRQKLLKKSDSCVQSKLKITNGLNRINNRIQYGKGIRNFNVSIDSKNSKNGINNSNSYKNFNAINNNISNHSKTNLNNNMDNNIDYNNNHYYNDSDKLQVMEEPISVDNYPNTNPYQMNQKQIITEGNENDEYNETNENKNNDNEQNDENNNEENNEENNSNNNDIMEENNDQNEQDEQNEQNNEDNEINDDQGEEH